MSRIIQVRDAVKELIDETLWPLASRDDATHDQVLTPWVFRVEADKHRGRKVYVLPMSYSTEAANRSEDQGDYTILLFVVERYTEQGDAPDDWVSERVNFCEMLCNSAANPRTIRLLGTGSPNSGLWPESGEVTVVFDPDELLERKLFTSTIEIVYREQSPA